MSDLRRGNGCDDGQLAERLLAAAQAAQTAFWEAVRELEAELDIEIDSSIDLNNQTIDSLLEDESCDGICPNCEAELQPGRGCSRCSGGAK